MNTNRLFLFTICLFMCLSCSVVSPLVNPDDTTEKPNYIESTTIPTLLPNEKTTYILDLFESNDCCDLPSLWGITPGLSTWQDMSTLLSPLGMLEELNGVIDDGRYETGISVGIDRDMALANLYFDVFGKNSIIEEIYVSAENSYSPPSSLASPEFKDTLSRYSMAAIIEKHGVPSRVLLELNNGPIEPNGIWHYHIIVFYDHLVFLIYYNYWGDGSISLNPDKGVLTVCPDHKSNTRIQFALTSPKNTNSLEKILERHQGIDLEYTKSLLETTNLTLKEFYDLFSFPNSTNCFESPGNAWH